MTTQKRAVQRNRTYGACPIKRDRRTKAAIEAIKGEIVDVLAQYRPATVRQTYYQLVARQVIDKTEAEYKTVCRLLKVMRRDGAVPYSWLADYTRYMRRPTTHSSLESALENTRSTYRRAVWDDQDCYVEIWAEKHGLAGVLWEVTAAWDVPLMLCGGYPSLTFVHGAACAIEDQDKPVYLYYLGDHDPSGRDIDRYVQKTIREFAPAADLHFERVAVTRDQINEFSLPTRPTKKSDSRAKSFDGESVEVDAIDPDTLRGICEQCIVQHVDQEAYQRLLAVEDAERDTLAAMISGMEDV